MNKRTQNIYCYAEKVPQHKYQRSADYSYIRSACHQLRQEVYDHAHGSRAKPQCKQTAVAQYVAKIRCDAVQTQQSGNRFSDNAFFFSPLCCDEHRSSKERKRFRKERCLSGDKTACYSSPKKQSRKKDNPTARVRKGPHIVPFPQSIVECNKESEEKLENAKCE